MNCPRLGICCRGTIGRVVDGDTLAFLFWNVLPVRVRLRYVWAAEVRKPEPLPVREFGMRAKAFLKGIAEQRRARLFISTEFAHDLDDVLTLDRVVGDVWLENDLFQSLNEKMVTSGLAFETKRELKEEIAQLTTPPTQ